MKGFRPAGYIVDELSHLDQMKPITKSSSWSIVAIPKADDYTWRISSEKVPHMTLLFLGKQSSALKAQSMADFLSHVASASLARFGLEVDRRGVLGDDEADVLFFDKSHMIPRLEEVRSYLLTNPYIYEAYNTAQQYPSWTPHLTLGYPETPAHPDLRDHPGINWVEFDRVALWTGDYEGPEFQLKRYDELEVGMSDDTSDFLTHYGVKGMKWGVRRDLSESSSGSRMRLSVPDSADATRTKNTLGKVYEEGGRTDSLSNKELQDVITRMNLEQQYARLSSQPNQIQNGQSYFKTAMKFGDDMNKVIKFAKSPAGKLLAKLIKSQFGGIRLGMKAAKVGTDLVLR